jgi:hypothetical protein
MRRLEPPETGMDDSFEFLILLLMENEKAISRLYEQFAETFSHDAPFWKDLSRQEKEHARLIGELGALVRKNKIGAGIAFSVKAVETSIKYIDILREKCRKGEITRGAAYTHAHDIERSLIEKRFFSVFRSGHPSIQKVRESLTAETEKHCAMIDEMQQTIQNQKPE